MPPAEASRPVMRGDAELDGSFAVRLAHTADAAGTARRAVKTRFSDVLAQEMLDDTLLVISELVTNAVQYGAGDIHLRVAFDGRRVTGDVSDEGMRFTQPLPTHAAGKIGGHGLYLVERVADSWGVAEGSSRVWFEILVSQAD